MKSLFQIFVLLFILSNSALAQGRLDFTYGKSSEDLGVSYFQTQYLGNSIGLEYTQVLGKRLSVSSGLNFSGWFLDEHRRAEVNYPDFLGECTCLPIVIDPPGLIVFPTNLQGYSAERLEIPLMVNLRIGKHEKLPFALRAGLSGIVNRIYTYHGGTEVILDKSLHYRMQLNLGLQVPVLQTDRFGIFIEPYGKLGRQTLDLNLLQIYTPTPDLIVDYGIKLGISIY